MKRDQRRGRFADTKELLAKPSNFNCPTCIANGVYSEPERLGGYWVCSECGFVARKG